MGVLSLSSLIPPGGIQEPRAIGRIALPHQTWKPGSCLGTGRSFMVRCGLLICDMPIKPVSSSEGQSSFSFLAQPPQLGSSSKKWEVLRHEAFMATPRMKKPIPKPKKHKPKSAIASNMLVSIRRTPVSNVSQYTRNTVTAFVLPVAACLTVLVPARFCRFPVWSAPVRCLGFQCRLAECPFPFLIPGWRLARLLR